MRFAFASQDRCVGLVMQFSAKGRLLPYAPQQIPGRRIVGATVRVRNINELRCVLGASGIAAPDVILTKQGRSVFLPPATVVRSDARNCYMVPRRHGGAVNDQ